MLKLKNNIREAYDRYDLHSRLRDQSYQLQRTLSRKEKTYIEDFMSAEITRHGGMGAGKYSKLGEHSARRLMKSMWEYIFKKAPRLSSGMIMYRVICNEHGKTVSSFRKGVSIDIFEYSSYTHSSNMVRKYAEFLDEESDICIMCVHVPAGTRFIYVSGLNVGSDVSVDDTQGEVILEPCVLSRIGGHVIKVNMLKRRFPHSIYSVLLIEMQYTKGAKAKSK
jgi:hypothetical protein